MESFPSFSNLESLSKSVETDDQELVEAALAWADSPSTSSLTKVPLSIATSTTTTSGAIDISEFDPFTTTNSLPPTPIKTIKPIYSTLGASVQSTSKLVLVDSSDDEDEELEGDDSRSSFSRAGEGDEKDLIVGFENKVEKSRNSNTGSSSAGGRSSGFLGGIFSSQVDTGLEKKQEGEKESRVEEKIQIDFNEKALPLQNSTPLPSLPPPTFTSDSSELPPPRSNSPIVGISNSLSSITSIFRSSSPAIPTKERSTKSASVDVKGKGKESNDAIVFDFNKFLTEMRLNSANSIAKYLRSFLKEFSRKPPISSVDQIRVINDFLDFIAVKMRLIDPWKSNFATATTEERGELEFDMVLEAMEKLVMNRLWHLVFTPAIDLTTLPQHVSPTDDLERDHVLTQRIKLFDWILPFHLDLPIPSKISLSSPVIPSSVVDDDTPTLSVKEESKKLKQINGFLEFGQTELNKINLYKAPRDKLICVLNACKVIFGLIRHISSDEGADSFIPFLIYIVLKANPEHLVSNLQFIQRFRNPEKLSGEGGYYLSSLNGAISFIETLDASSLSNITQAEFETNVANAISRFPKDPLEFKLPPSPTNSRFSTSPPPTKSSKAPPLIDDSESPSLIHPIENENSFSKTFFKSTEQVISKPLEAIGRIFEQLESFADVKEDNFNQHPGRAMSIRSNRSGRSSNRPMRSSFETDSSLGIKNQEGRKKSSEFLESGNLIGDIFAIDASVEQQRLASIETLRNIFPGMEGEVLEMVLLSNDNNMDKTIECLLDM